MQHAHLAHCDCACVFEPPPAGLVPESRLWVRQKQALSLPLEKGWRAYFNPLGPVSVAALNPAAQRLLASFDIPTLPAAVPGKVVHDLIAVGLLQAVDAEPLPAPAPLTLSAWLHVTEECNLSCPYCYVDKQRGIMSPKVGRRAVERLVEVARRYGYARLRLKYAGGEPTLNLPLVQMIHRYATRWARAAGIELQEVLLTNGIGVNDQALDELAQAGMQLMVSLDGGPAAHDRLRPRRDGNGRSTYAIVAGLVERAMARGLRPDISITVTALNLDGVPQAAAFALERDLPFNLNFYRACPSTCASSQHDALVPEPHQLVEAILAVFERVRWHPDYAWPLSGILDRVRFDLPHDRACSAGRDYLVVDTAGRVAACQMLLGTPWSDLDGEDLLGTVRQQGGGLFRPVTERPGCQDCTWRTACAGGCPLSWGSALHTTYCRAYRSLLPELVRLEGERLRRQQRLPA